jgi:hypothetical protein
LSCGRHGTKSLHHRGIGGIACYIRKIISPQIQIHKINPLNQYIWIEISDTNANDLDYLLEPEMKVEILHMK